uniref:STPR domain-containing protein n=1 Tax=Adineta vaga TaxID=104782 RepID=G3KGW5_ADIVA|nr:hypothetical protein [Adineta vaga]
MTVQCIFCSADCADYCCLRCNQLSRGQKFGLLLQYLEKCSQSIVHFDEILSAVQRIQKVKTIMTTLEFNIYDSFDERIHMPDNVAKQYLEKASVDVRHLIPADVAADGNCLYHSECIALLTVIFLFLVPTIIELIRNESFYSNMYAHLIGPFDMAIKGVCRNHTFSELYEICALSTVIKCNIRSVYPEIDFRREMAIMNDVFSPAPPVNANHEIKILWSNVWSEMNVRSVNDNIWSPNHFVPLMLPSVQNESDFRIQSILTTKTPEKKSVKNNVAAQIRMPEFESSPNRRLRSDKHTTSNPMQLINFEVIEQCSIENKEQHQMRLSILKERARSRRNSETDQQREDRLKKVRERAQSRRMNETENERNSRLEQNKQRIESIRISETENERENRLDQERERVQSQRMNETDEEHQLRINHQQIRSQANRIKKRFNKQESGNKNIQAHHIYLHSNKNRSYIHRVHDSMDDFVQNERMTRIQEKHNSTVWPTPTPRPLKEGCLQQYLQRMSMS